MDPETENQTPPPIPPPVFSAPPPPPPSPLDAMHRSNPQNRPDVGGGAGPVKSNLHNEVEDDEAPERVSFNTRLIAAVIDWVLATGIYIALIMILPGFTGKLAWLVAIAYIITRDSLPFLGGQSVGKKAMKIKVVTLDDKALTGNWEAALIRNGVLLIPFFGFIEVFILLTREDKPERGRRLGDEWAKTKVVSAPIEVSEGKSE